MGIYCSISKFAIQSIATSCRLLIKLHWLADLIVPLAQESRSCANSGLSTRLLELLVLVWLLVIVVDGCCGHFASLHLCNGALESHLSSLGGVQVLVVVAAALVAALADLARLTVRRPGSHPASIIVNASSAPGCLSIRLAANISSHCFLRQGQLRAELARESV